MTDFHCKEIAQAALGPPAKRSGGELLWCCPNHDDVHPSLCVNSQKNCWLCGPCGASGSAWELAAFLAKVSPDNKTAVKTWLREHSLLNGRDERKRVAEYIYCDAEGHPVGKVVRWSPKAFHQERPDGKGGWELGGFPRTLYRLPEILKAPSALIGEGEKDVDAAWEKLGIPATTSGNAGSWKPEFAEFLRDKSVCVIPHRDKPGHRHARAVAKSLLGVALRVRLLELPGEKVKDLSDWIEAGGTRDQLLDLIKRTPELTSEDVAAWEVASPARGGSGSHRTTAIAVMRRASEIEPRAVRWLWPKRIPFGKLTLFAGDPDEGKTAVALDIAARVTTGGEWGDGGRAETGSVIIMTAEDDPDDTLVPRLIAAGADLGRVHFLEASRCITADGKETTRAVTLADIDTIEDALSQAGDAKLVVVDPVSAYLSDADSHKNAEVRALLSPLRELAARRGVAILVITHLSKSGGSALYRAIGSIAFVAASRAAWFFGKDKENPGRRLMLRLKGNLAPEVGGLAYKLEEVTLPLKNGQQVPIVKVMWEQGAVNLMADDILATDSPGRASRLAEAKEWLKEILAAGPRPADDVLGEAQAHGIKVSTLRRARKALGVEVRKQGFAEGWEYALRTAEQPHEDAHYDRHEHLRASDCNKGRFNQQDDRRRSTGREVGIFDGAEHLGDTNETEVEL